MLSCRSRESVGGAAGAERNHELDGLLGVSLLGEGIQRECGGFNDGQPRCQVSNDLNLESFANANMGEGSRSHEFLMRP
jgi:hypothetical protein